MPDLTYIQFILVVDIIVLLHYMLKFTVLLLTLLALIDSQSCVNNKGEEVPYWIAFKVPPRIGKIAYGYFDPTMSYLDYINAQIDLGETALTRTL